MTDFASLGLIKPLLRALEQEGYKTPSPIQGKSIPLLLEGRDIIAVAQTGTGKTASFALPILQYLAEGEERAKSKRPNALILAPTRELAIQIEEGFVTYGRHLNLRSTAVFGGVPLGKQIATLARGVDILVATPGRLMDLMNQGKVFLDEIDVFVLDEADRMLDMGFIHDVRKVAAKLPSERQTVLFSATMPATVATLAKTLLEDPARVEIAPESTTVERIEQSVFFVAKQNKSKLLREVLYNEEMTRVIVFTRTKHGADKVVKHLESEGVKAGAIHGNKSQNNRQKTLKAFKNGEIRALIATDIAARGIDVDDVSHVINFELPHEPESYVHRIGRTARAGNDGQAMSFCEVDEHPLLKDIQKTIRMDVPVFVDHPFHDADVGVKKAEKIQRGGQRGGGRNGGGNGGGRGRGQAGQGKGQGGHGPKGQGPSNKGARHNRRGPKKAA